MQEDNVNMNSTKLSEKLRAYFAATDKLEARVSSLESQFQLIEMLLNHIEEMYQPKPLLPLLLTSWFAMGGMLALLIWRWNG